jgi:hypothetical protein
VRESGGAAERTDPNRERHQDLDTADHVGKYSAGWAADDPSKPW